MDSMKLGDLLEELGAGVYIGRCISCLAMFVNVPPGTQDAKCSECGRNSVFSDEPL